MAGLGGTQRREGTTMELTILDRHRTDIEGGLSRALAGEGPLRTMLRYHVGLADADGAPAHHTGKLLRPSLVLFVARQLGATEATALPAAVGLELIHGFSLIHDDIQDRDRLRRGRPAVWTVWGVEQAINAGDLMQAIAIETALAATPTAAARLLRATVEMIEGQALDLAFERRPVSATEYTGMIDRKTGALIRCAFELGGIVAGAGDGTCDQLAELGQEAGRAFQIRDDLLGIWGDANVLGKATGSDIRRRKKTLPIVLLFEHAGRDVTAELEAIYDTSSTDVPLGDDDVEQVLDRLDRFEIRSACETMAQRHVDRAIDRIAALPFSGEGREHLEKLLAYLARRVR